MLNLFEDVHSQSSKLRVDRERGVIYGVKVLGERSANGRRYTREAIRKARPLYEGAKVNLNHPARASDIRGVQDRFGKLQNISVGNDGAALYGDLHYLKSHPHADVVAEAAERMPDAFGLSHNCQGRPVSRNGEIVVEEIEAVKSVDIVSDPATTSGMFEGTYEPSRPDDLLPTDTAALRRALFESGPPTYHSPVRKGSVVMNGPYPGLLHDLNRRAEELERKQNQRLELVEWMEKEEEPIRDMAQGLAGQLSNVLANYKPGPGQPSRLPPGDTACIEAVIEFLNYLARDEEALARDLKAEKEKKAQHKELFSA